MKLKEEVLIIVTTLRNKESDTKSWIHQIKINRKPQLLLGCESAWSNYNPSPAFFEVHQSELDFRLLLTKYSDAKIFINKYL